MHGVILAAGENRRLRSKIEPFTKPLVEIDGAPLVAQIANDMQDICERIVVVVSPRNAERIIAALSEPFLPSRLRFVIQPEPKGPGQALQLGLEAVATSRVLVCMGDNVIPYADLCKVAEQPEAYVIGVKISGDTKEVERFARVTEGGKFLDGHPSNDLWSDGKWRAWLGPLIVPRLLQHSEQHRAGEKLITPLLNSIGGYPKLVEVDAVDIGTPEALAALTT